MVPFASGQPGLPSCHTPLSTLLCPRHMARSRLDDTARCRKHTASLPTTMPFSDKRVIDPPSHQLVHGSADRSQLSPRLASHTDTTKRVAHTPITHRLASYNLSVVCLQQSQDTDTDTLALEPPPTMIGQHRVVGGCIPRAAGSSVQFKLSTIRGSPLDLMPSRWRCGLP
ncbi:hypothetical protein HDV63DRAFT_238975 [Trichoderma sp. SZMC 28014]